MLINALFYCLFCNIFVFFHIFCLVKLFFKKHLSVIFVIAINVLAY